jgi:sigma-B regulation protein RsbU (phosphoserine phosphatase)
LRDQVKAVLGHGLRNPLASIDASARMLVKEPLSPKGATLVGLIQSSVSRMTELIVNVRDLARGAWEVGCRWSVTHGRH